MTDCTGHHYRRDLSGIKEGAWLVLCDGCEVATLVEGTRQVDAYPSALDAEAALPVRIAEAG